MTLAEFLSPLAKGTQKDLVLAVLLYKKNYEGVESLSSSQIRDSFKNARIKNWRGMNISRALNEAGYYAEKIESREGATWSITKSGRNYISDLLGVEQGYAEIEEDQVLLRGLVKDIHDDDTKEYIEEAVKCLGVDARRACVVFIWSGAIRYIQQMLLNEKNTHLNDVISKHDPKARKITTLDHFAYVKEKTQLLAARDLGLFDKHEIGELENALNLRNRCGHPGNYNPGHKKVSSTIEDITNIVFNRE